ncbi:S8 family serine peptidase [Euryarchaeota archaeon]|nr:S8 family serine peptidase [Euryarchaeota archaeon]|tara:strand:- start:16492 stop:17643 length:1152 start_codon:yes stop_codon:yes gene_type:complete
MENEDSENIFKDVIRGSQYEKDDDSAVYFISIAVTLLISFLLISVSFLYLWPSIEEISSQGPSGALIIWEDEYREITGINNVEYLDGSGITLCIVDSGIDMNHPGLEGLKLEKWSDFVNQIEDPYDDEGHGTAMAGIIVAKNGLKGNAQGVTLLVAKAIDKDGTGTDQIISQSVDWCVENGAHIISLSLGGEQGFGAGIFTTDALEQSVENALDLGVFIVAAAGNDGENDDGDVESPGSVGDVICVGGITRDGDIWKGSSIGDNDGRFFPNPIFPRSNPDKKPEIVAPSQEVPILMASGVGNNNWWGWSSGTSAATAWVSGSLSLLLEEYPELQRQNNDGRESIEEVKNLLSQTSQMKDNQTEHDDYYGYGIMRIDLMINSKK